MSSVCNELVYTGKNIKTMENHWKSACTGNKYCELKYNDKDFLKIKYKPVHLTICVPCTIMSYGYQT